MWLSPPATLAQQKRVGYLLIAAAISMAGAGAVRIGIDDESWIALGFLLLVTASIAAAGASHVVAARRGRLRFDEQQRHRQYRAGYRAFCIVFIVIGSDATFELLEGAAHWVYLWIGLLTFLGSMAYDKRRR